LSPDDTGSGEGYEREVEQNASNRHIKPIERLTTLGEGEFLKFNSTPILGSSKRSSSSIRYVIFFNSLETKQDDLLMKCDCHFEEREATARGLK
jgi:hypothetical protein